MYICIHISIYIYVYVCMGMCMYVYVCICMYMHVFSHICVYNYVCISFIFYRAYVQSDALFPCLYLSLWSMPLSVPGLIIVTPSSLAYQNPAWLHCNLSLMWLLV